jgi:hypothetical protein
MRNYILMSIRFSRLCKLIIRNRGVSPRNIFKLIPLFFSGIISEFFTLDEKVRYGRRLKKYPVPDNPLFIVSHWRTGSTLLHELMDLDARFNTPSLLDTIIPEHSLVSMKYYRKFVGHFIGSKRPIDNFSQTTDSASEHEYAILKMTGDSPLEAAIFHSSRGKEYILDEVGSFVPEGRNKILLRKSFINLAKKISMKDSRQPLFKNPWDSMRISWLKEIFPKAKFIHIYRRPEKVVPSTLRMWDKVVSDNLLKGKPYHQTLSDGARWYLHFENTIAGALESLPPEDYVSIRYEDLIADPVSIIRRVYKGIGMTEPENLEQTIPRYMEENKGNKSPKTELTSEEIAEIREVMKDYLKEKYPEITKETPQ